jgi:hypothetical protein
LISALQRIARALALGAQLALALARVAQQLADRAHAARGQAFLDLAAASPRTGP